jgi:hypothetical protein
MQYKIKLASSFLGLSLLFASAHAIGGLPGESIVLDPNTGDYTLNYWDSDAPDARIRQAIFVPSTKIDPSIQSIFKLKGKSEVVYTYRVTNGIKSRQPLNMMLFDPVSDIISSIPLPKQDRDVDLNAIEQILVAGASALTTPANWIGRNTTSHAGGLRVGWSYRGDGGLIPGKTQAGFGFSSKDIPGIGIAQMQGDSPVPMFPGEGPTGGLAKEFAPIEQNDFITRNAATPTIAVPTPFDAAVTLERIQTQMHTWIGMSLLDSAFSAQLDRYFQSAISAYRLNQPKVGKKQIQTMRELIKKEQPNAGNGEGDNEGDSQNKNKPALIDPLAARVLDFDLNYVMKRAGEGESESEGEHASTSTSKPVPSPSKPQHER